MKLPATFRDLLLFLFFMLSINYSGSAQEESPKREFRGVWIATVNNIDYPRTPSAQRIAIQEQWRLLLNDLQKVGFNAVIMQVRPASDALYPSKLVPWSKYLTGEPDKAPVPIEFDPLEFMIKEAHDRGMEFHAWLNPYRVTTNLDTANLSPRHVFRQHRDWVVRYGDRFYLNPGLPQVRDHLVDVVTEIVSNYDIDAIHFDDYFYPYKIAGQTFPDSLTHYIYGQYFKNRDDWRRNNVSELVQKVSQAVKGVKPHVKFGISPFGVWRNKAMDPLGSETRAGATTYDDLYADVLLWLREGWIDYVIPQVYWNIGFPPADHNVLVNWWAQHSFGKQLFIGHAAYKVGNNREPAWNDPKEIPRQIELNRRNWLAQGSAFFSSKSVLQNSLGVRDSITTLYRHPALLPAVEEANVAEKKPPVLRKARSKQGDVKLKWKPDKLDRTKLPAYYAVYRIDAQGKQGFDDGASLLKITPFFEDQKRYQFVDETAQANKTYVYAVTALTREHVESKRSQTRKVKKTTAGLKNINESGGFLNNLFAKK